MNRFASSAVIGVVSVLSAVVGVGAEEAAQSAEAQMPPMSPPQELAKLNTLVGTWDVAGKYKMDPNDTSATEYTAVATYEWKAGGGVMTSEYSQPFMGSEMKGLSLMGYDSELKKWYTSWVDNMSGRLSIYYGEETGDTLMFQGNELWQGMKFQSRVKIYDRTENSYNWLMENSYDGGQTWSFSMDAVYTKRK